MVPDALSSKYLPMNYTHLDCGNLNFEDYLLDLLSEPPAILDLESQLLEASKAGDLETVQRLISTYPHIVNCRDLDGRYSPICLNFITDIFLKFLKLNNLLILNI